ncbi:MAG: hypothetical protein LH614_10815 [Pyrinomonadaceae bacterium]|nr:hypothetical protein [Pyrinomonadaceae bacterium]
MKSSESKLQFANRRASLAVAHAKAWTLNTPENVAKLLLTCLCRAVIAISESMRGILKQRSIRTFQIFVESFSEYGF